MAEKNFKITGGLALGDYALTANALSLLWDGNAIATQAYVDAAAPAVNTNAIAESLVSTTLWVSEGDNLNVNTNAIVGNLNGAGLYVTGNQLAVNTNVIATKDYVDSVAQGLDVKASVRVASTENIDLATWNPMSQIDGTNINIPNRVLLKNQTDKSQNGIYTPDTSGTLVRATDADTTADFNKGAFTFVEEGTNAGKGFVVTAAGTLGTDEISWSQFSEAGSLTAGTNIYLANNEINVNVNALVGDLDGAGLYVTGNQLAVNVNTLAGSGLISSDGILAVDVDYLAGGPGLYSQEGQIRINPYAEGIRYDGEAAFGQNAQVVTDTFYGSTTDANTYVTVASLERNVGFVADIWMKIPGTSLSRKSTLSGTADNSGNVEYTEYAIVDSATPLGSPDIAIEYNIASLLYSIVAKSDLASEETLAVFVDLKTLSSPI